VKNRTANWINLVEKGTCNVQRKFVLMIVLALAAVVAACGTPEAGREWNISTAADQLVVEADTRGGFVPVEWAATHIPDFRLYGDGRAIWSEKPDDGTTVVWEGRLSEQQVRELLDWMDEQGFFEMEEYYTVDNAPTDLPSSCIVVTLQDRTHSVCQYYDGAPEAFDAIYQRLQAGADASDVETFEPEIGWVTSRLVEGASPTDATPWPDGLSPAVSTFGQGNWIEGEALDFLWSRRLQSGPLLFEQDGSVYQVVLQIPGVMPDAPPAPQMIMG